ncbi:hypothetical protein HYH03_007817 [Edaphochlamys debaryana]|uniref:Uncharacterized protein n=1 Tax=Edaphochlamys debaryana TaxID=47281 RepID=A0A835Y7K7_9CHLO|nr:hypothetical protein HYH03_007817 [Edaphochlamys debaryana]|eukprot:KAG2493880.1 hypothetical protein HYH03_007817 [Edaphochlamys debaryana]
MSASPPPPDFVHKDWGPYVGVAFIALANILCYCCNDNSVFGRLLWRRHGLHHSSFFASNTRRGSGWRHSRDSTQFWAFDVLDPASVVSSPWLNAWGLLALHTLTLSWLGISMAVEAAADDGVESSWLTWFTHWSLVLLSAAGGVGVMLQARYMWLLRREGCGLGRVTHEPPPSLVAADAHGGVGARVALGPRAPSPYLPAGAYPLAEAAEEGRAASEAEPAPKGAAGVVRWDWLSITFVLAMQAAVTAAFFLDIYFWVVMIAFQGDPAGGPATYLKHAGNMGIALMEVFLTRLPIVSVHVQTTLAYGTCYMIFLWIYGSETDQWRYGLNWYKSGSVAMYALVPIALVVFMIIWWGIALGREAAVNALARRRAGAAGATEAGTGGGKRGGAVGADADPAAVAVQA